MLAGQWNACKNHPVLQLELRRVRRRRWLSPRLVLPLYVAVLFVATLGGAAAGLALVQTQAVDMAPAIIPATTLCPANALAWLLGFAVPWIAPAFTATSIAQERERGTWDLVRTTTLSERSLVWAKLLGAMARLWPALLAMLLLIPFQLLLGVSVGGSILSLLGEGATFDPATSMGILPQVLAVQLAPWAHLALHTTTGLFVSALSRSSGTALAATYGAVIALRVASWFGNNILSALIIVLLSIATIDPFSPPTLLSNTAVVTILAVLGTLVSPALEGVAALGLVWATIWRLKKE